MIPSKASLLGSLPPYKDEWIVVKDKQNVKDIMHEICDSHEEFAPFYNSIALYFDADNVDEICSNIYDFLKKNVSYHEEKEEDQTTSLPAGILSRGYGDCKHYASFAGGVLDGINRMSGKDIDWAYKFASYDLLNRTPHHVFVSATDEKGDEIWIDPTPGSSEQIPVWLTQKKVGAMLRRNIAGFYHNEPEPVQQMGSITIPSDLLNAVRDMVAWGVMSPDAKTVSDEKLLELSASLSPANYQSLINDRHILQRYVEEGFFDYNTIGQAADIITTGLTLATDVFSLFSSNTNYDAEAAQDGFSAVCYLARYPDVKQNWHGDPAEHWIRHGKAEGRIPGCQPLPAGITLVNGLPVAANGLAPGFNVTPGAAVPPGGSSIMMPLLLGGGLLAAFLLSPRNNKKR